MKNRENKINAELIKENEILHKKVSELENAEETLKQSEKNYRAIFNNATDAIYIQDSKGCFLDVNKGAEDMYGYPREYFIGKTPEFLSAPGKNDMKKIIGFVEDAFKGKPRQYDFWGIRKNGEVFPKIVRSQNGIYMGKKVIVTFAIDITERKQAEEALQESEEKYRFLVESLEEGIIAVDENENVTFVNPAACKILGYTKEKLLKMNFKEILTPKYHKKILQQTAKRKTGKTGKYDMNIIKKNSDICIVTTSVSPIFKNGKFKGSFGIIHDITERKKAEQALHKYTLELQERNEELDAFSHTVAHDLKNPLGTIMGFAELLFENYSEFSKDEILNYLNIIIKDSKKTQQIINNLLLFASVRKAEIKMEELNMRDIVAESIKSLTPIIEKNNAEIILSNVLPPSLGYAPWIEEVWTNYLSNAIKYGGTPPRIKIGADTDKAENVPKGMVRFWVCDNGQGISANNQKLLFEKFERINQVIAEGHGLGLSIVRRIIKKLGGQVGMESNPDSYLKGSLFYFTLPFISNTLHETRNLKPET